MTRYGAPVACLLGFCAVAFGAFGAHGLREHFAQYPQAKEWYDKAVFYHFIHALALTQVKTWGAITPVGGVAFLLGWLALAAAEWMRQNAGA